MINVESQTVLVKGVQVRGAGQSSAGILYDVRISLVHEPDSVDALPECNAALKSILKEQQRRSDKADNESKDVITLKLKRDLPVCRYVLGIFGDNSASENAHMFAKQTDSSTRGEGASGTPQSDTVADFRGSVAGQPSISAVHGMLKVSWKVDSLIDAPTLVALSTMIGSEWVAGSIAPLQGKLDLEAA